MDLTKAIRELYEEKKRLDEVIARLEAILEGGLPRAGAPRRRGRAGMSPQERLEVSRRMKEYWARRRQGPGGAKGE